MHSRRVNLETSPVGTCMYKFAISIAATTLGVVQPANSSAIACHRPGHDLFGLHIRGVLWPRSPVAAGDTGNQANGLQVGNVSTPAEAMACLQLAILAIIQIHGGIFIPLCQFIYFSGI